MVVRMCFWVRQTFHITCGSSQKVPRSIGSLVRLVNRGKEKNTRLEKSKHRQVQLCWGKSGDITLSQHSLGSVRPGGRRGSWLRLPDRALGAAEPKELSKLHTGARGPRRRERKDTFLLRFPRCCTQDSTPAHAQETRSPGAGLNHQSTYVKSQSPGAGPTTSNQRAQTTSPLRIFAVVVLKPALPRLLPAPSAPRPPPLARVVLAVGLGTRKGIGPRVCHVNWVGIWENWLGDGHPRKMGTVTLGQGAETDSPPPSLSSSFFLS
ncbi:uncharacterized protein LOC128576982 [Nycticebus coucang]|uniref:uncharacterized protein LOC128576982 n=1 Tax=Nycticebus coucang TaxID=9470 RepID=UPI00234DB9D2|nr:uncharacterized protein LOC128576982 [Nycticebus coucang]